MAITSLWTSQDDNAASSGAGGSLTLAVSFTGQLPPNYAAFVGSGRSGVVGMVTSWTSPGFTGELLPVLTTATVTAGTSNILEVS
jgi:inner membrane protein involved in colicin E2 resistance